MAEVQGNQHGIKLFGQTIVLEVKEENPRKIDQKEEEDRDDEADNDMMKNKPDKIIPCPRCKSMETKFCYFNNYNVNQPRHFCKGCQRYWTAGGALRNVPVGAGRRKTKPGGRPGGFHPLFDGVNIHGHEFDLNGVDRVVVDEWQLAAAMAAGGGFRHGFQVKRRRSESNDQSC